MFEMNKFPINKVDSVITLNQPNLPAQNSSQLPHPTFTGEVKIVGISDLGVEQNLYSRQSIALNGKQFNVVVW